MPAFAGRDRADHYAADKAAPDREREPEFANEIDYLEYVCRNSTKPDRLRYMVAKACADFHYPTLKAVAQVSSKGSVLDPARARAATSYCAAILLCSEILAWRSN
jgi:hypothetical protein